MKKNSSSHTDKASCVGTTDSRARGGAAGMYSWSKRKPFTSRYCLRHTQCAVSTGTSKHTDTNKQLATANRRHAGTRRCRTIAGMRRTGAPMMAAVTQLMKKNTLMLVTWWTLPNSNSTFKSAEIVPNRTDNGKKMYLRIKKHRRALSRHGANKTPSDFDRTGCRGPSLPNRGLASEELLSMQTRLR